MSYAADAADARAMIREAGVSATLRRTAPGTYDPVTGAMGAATVLTQTVDIVILPQSSGRDTGYEGGGVGSMTPGTWSTYKQGMRRKLLLAIAPDATWEPYAGDEVQFEGQWWKLDSQSAIRPDGDVAVLFEVPVSR